MSNSDGHSNSDPITGGRHESLGHVGIETSDDDLRNVYERWATSFNQDIEDDVKYVGHLSVCQVVEQYFPKEESSGTSQGSKGQRSSLKVIDIGAGTGLVGSLLAPEGFSQIDALDFSPKMLSKAAELGVYTSLIEANLNEELKIEKSSYDLAISAGTFTLGHVTAKCIPNILSVLKPGGLFIFTVREDLMQSEELKTFYRFPEYLKELESVGVLECVEQKDEMPYHLLAGKSFDRALNCTVFVCKKL